MRKKKVLVLLEVEVDANIPNHVVQEHIQKEAHAARGQFTDYAIHPHDWRSDITVSLKDIRWFVRQQRDYIRRKANQLQDAW